MKNWIVAELCDAKKALLDYRFCLFWYDFVFDIADFLNLYPHDVPCLHERRGLHGRSYSAGGPHKENVTNVERVGLGEMFNSVKAIENKMFSV